MFAHACAMARPLVTTGPALSIFSPHAALGPQLLHVPSAMCCTSRSTRADRSQTQPSCQLPYCHLHTHTHTRSAQQKQTKHPHTLSTNRESSPMQHKLIKEYLCSWLLMPQRYKHALKLDGLGKKKSLCEWLSDRGSKVEWGKGTTTTKHKDDGPTGQG